MEEVKPLPSEIISDILSRLPIESLMVCKSVCKSWFSLIADESFVELQLKRSQSQPHRVILWDCDRTDKVLLLDKDKGQKDLWKARNLILEYTWKYWEKESKLVFHIVGSCNGLLCMVSSFDYGCCSVLSGIFICNPITNECVMLPVDNGGYIHQIGFGVDSKGKYKVIKIYQKMYPSTFYDNYLLKGEIITLGESSWREIDIPYHTISSRGGCVEKRSGVEEMSFVNGLLYCIIQNRNILEQPIILAFDLHDEKFRTIEFPPSIELPYYYDKDYELVLTEINGSLALHQRLAPASIEIYTSVIHLWFLAINKSKGNELYHCDHISVAIAEANLFDYFSLVGMPSNNLLLYKRNDSEFLSEQADPQVVAQWGSHLLGYCLEKKQLMSIRVSGEIPRWFHAKSFVPSLVSPISIACDKTKKDTRSRIQGLQLEVVGYSSFWELMDSCRLHRTFRSLIFSCHPRCKRTNGHRNSKSEETNGQRNSKRKRR